MSKKRIKILRTIDACIDAAGGDAAVARRLGYRDGRAVWNHRQRKYFPPYTYDAWQEILKELNATAPDELWRFRPLLARGANDPDRKRRVSRSAADRDNAGSADST